jgi:2'-5' RNA ligase
MRQVRAFLAIPLPADVLDKVQQVQNELAGALPEVRWTSLATMHLTLKFFGSISEESLEKIGEVMLSIGRLCIPFQIEIGGVGAFPSLDRPRVIWVGAREAHFLVALQSALEEELQKIGIPREDRPYSPHLTLGRSRGRIPAGREILEKYRNIVCGTMLVEKVILFESRLYPAGSVHLPLKTFCLGR